MTIKRRIEKLEQAEALQGGDKITAIVSLSVAKQPDGTLTEEIHCARILAGPFGDSVTLYREEGESDESMNERVDVEVERLHGYRIDLRHCESDDTPSLCAHKD
jgi:hypothetical protein